MKERIYLAPPNIDQKEKDSILSAIDSGWIAPMGPSLDEFERMLSAHFQGRKVLLLNSGTSALHLSLILAGVGEGNTVITSSLTFAACANVILYQKAIPVFMDNENETWNLDPEVLASYLEIAHEKPKAIIVTHLYGVPAKIKLIKKIAEKYDIKLIEDAAEALGSTIHGNQVGSFGEFGVVSFNGNKIITTSGGGALICNEENYARGLHIATQANRGAGEYDHDMVGYNYRMSNILAGLGESQFGKLDDFLIAKRNILNVYKMHLSDYFLFPKELDFNASNHWLTTGLIKSDHRPTDLIVWLEKDNIESRRLWKPLHLHKAYQSFKFHGDGVCVDLFQKGVCLPSGTGLSEELQLKVISSIQKFFES